MRTLAILAFALALPCSYGDDEAKKKDMSLLEGEFTMVSAVQNGTDMPAERVKTGRRVAKGSESTVSFDGKLYVKAKYTLDPGKKPKTIDYSVIEGMNQGKTMLGIYEIDGDTLKFCFAQPDKPRPAEFGSKADSGHVFSVWKREKK